MKKFVLITIVGLLLSQISSAQASTPYGPKWHGQPVIELQLRSEMASDWDDAIQATLAAWNCDLSGFPVGFPQGHIDYVANQCAGYTTVVHITRLSGLCDGNEDFCVRPFYLPGWYAAYINLFCGNNICKEGSHQHITYGEIGLNIAFLTYPSHQVLCHELGHGLGLEGHFYGYGPPSCTTEGPSHEWPHAQDYATLASMY